MSQKKLKDDLMLTLEAARTNCGWTLEEAAKRFSIHRDTLSRREIDSSRVSREFMHQVEEVYGVPREQIFFGKKSDFFRIKQSKTEGKYEKSQSRTIA